MRGGCRTFWSALALMLIAPVVMAADDGLATAYSRLQQAAAAPGPIHLRNEQLRKLYAASIAPQQTVGHAATATPADLATLYDAAGFMASTVRDTAYLRDMQLDLSELQRRKLDTDAVYQSMYGALVITRRFPEATTLARRHRSAKLDVLPRLVESSDLRKSGPTELAFSPDGKTLTRQHVNLGKGMSMVIVGGPERCRHHGGRQRDRSRSETQHRLTRQDHPRRSAHPDTGCTCFPEVECHAPGNADDTDLPRIGMDDDHPLDDPDVLRA